MVKKFLQASRHVFFLKVFLVSHKQHIYQYVQATPVQEVNRKDALEVEEKAYPPSPTQEKKDARSRKVNCLLVL